MMNRQPAKTKSQQPPPSKPTVSPPPAKAESPKVEPKPVALDYNPMYQNPPAPEAVDKPVVELREEKKLTISPFGIQQSLVRTLPGNTLKKAKKRLCFYLRGNFRHSKCLNYRAAKKNKKSSKKKVKSDSDSDSSSSSSSTSSSSSSSSSDSEDERKCKPKTI
jgi:outer membrane biosynthesis protein TonB